MSKTKRRANELDGRDWLRNSISIWSDIRKTPQELALKHPALFPQALVERLLACFTTPADQVVL
ncbi:MAG: site-specific DNA-methyltransferase, partial [Delftia sp.]|nr:site-specific DNA-methyltransferase [Delftia sp.]